MPYRRLLVPLDDSPTAQRGLGEALALARELRGALVLLHVVENAGAHPLGEKRTAPALLAGTLAELARARELLEPRRKAFQAQATVEVLVAPSVPHALCDYAAQNGISLIALSSHGRSGFRRLVMGSVAEAVLRNSRVPVLVFPRQE